MNLAQQIQAAQEKFEQKIAIPGPQHDLNDSESMLLLRHWAGWCRSRGVKFCPAVPGVVASFIRSEAAARVPADRILATLRAIEQLHDNQAFANPVACSGPRAELERILVLELPRWNKHEQMIFCGLAPDIREIIARHSLLESKAIRKAQNENAQLRQQLEKLQPHKGI